MVMNRSPSTDGGGAGGEQIPAVLVLVRDLMMGSRITAAARQAGTAVRMVRDVSRLRELTGRRLIVDLNEPGSIAAAVEWKQRTGGDAVGFVSHVDTPVIQEARAAGVDRILPRSRFVEELPELLAGSDQ
jgi:hypothetical protein